METHSRSSCWFLFVLISLAVSPVIGTASWSWTVSFQAIGGEVNQSYISTSNAGVDKALVAGSTAETWTLEPMDIGLDEFGFKVTYIKNGFKYKWKSDATNGDQLRCNTIDGGIYDDYDRFHLKVHDWDAHEYKIKNKGSDTWVRWNDDVSKWKVGASSETNAQIFKLDVTPN